MLLDELIDLEPDEAYIIRCEARPRLPDDLLLLLEATVEIHSFTYEKAKNDPKPEVLVLGDWQHPTTGNLLICGINLNYLDDEQKKTLYHILPKIVAKDTV